MTAAQTLRNLRLERFSNEMARFFVAAHPEWLKYMKPVPDEEDGLTVYRLSLEFPSENPSVAEPLVLSIDEPRSRVKDGCRVINADWFIYSIGHRWNYDWVFYEYAVPKPSFWIDLETGFRCIVDWLERFFAEELVGTYGPLPPYASGCMKPGEIRSVELQVGATSQVVRSWKGTFDAGQIPT